MYLRKLYTMKIYKNKTLFSKGEGARPARRSWIRLCVLWFIWCVIFIVNLFYANSAIRLWNGTQELGLATKNKKQKQNKKPLEKKRRYDGSIYHYFWPH